MCEILFTCGFIFPPGFKLSSFDDCLVWNEFRLFKFEFQRWKNAKLLTAFILKSYVETINDVVCFTFYVIFLFSFFFSFFFFFFWDIPFFSIPSIHFDFFPRFQFYEKRTLIFFLGGGLSLTSQKINKMSSRQGLEYTDCISKKRVSYSLPRECPVYDTKMHLRVRSTSGDLRSVEYPFITINIGSEWTRSGITFLGYHLWVKYMFRNYSYSIGKILRNKYTKIINMNWQWTRFLNLYV